MAEIWSNWAGNQRTLATIERPTTEPELCSIVQRAANDDLMVRAVGAGHSFTDIALSNAVLLSLEDYGRILSIDTKELTVTVQAGAQLRSMSDALWTRGLAFQNLGDIDVQSLAGAASTATHGTGAEFKNIASQIVGLRVIDSNGSVIVCDANENSDLLRVARVGVGSVGLISTITIRVVPAFNLRAVEAPLRFQEAVESFDERVASNDHFEFFYVPHTDWTLSKTNDRNNDVPSPRGRFKQWTQEMLLENYAFGLANRVAAWRPSLVPKLATAIPSSGTSVYNDRSYRVFASPRKVRFLEMEYAIPLEHTMTALQAVRQWIDSTETPTMFPIEVRAVAGDDIALSTASGRPTGYVAVHTYKGTPHEAYFHAVEAIMMELGGRPHWGKLHYRTAHDLAPAYPEWDSFQDVRRRLDPAGIFQNAYSNRVLGPLKSF